MKGQLTTKKINRFRRYIAWRNIIFSFLQSTLSGIKSFDQLFVITIAIIIGVAAGYVAGGFRTLISYFSDLFWGNGPFLEMVISAPIYLKVLIPVIGIVFVAIFVQRFAPEAKGHGVPEVMNAIATQSGFIRMRVVLVKAFASAVSIASGAAVGREGPIVQIGSAFGSIVGQIFQVSQRRMKTFVGCGAAAGIAATFNAPIAGAIFASEIILGDFSAGAIGPIIISSVFATVISRGMYGDFPAFVPPVYSLHSPLEILFYIILGVVTGFAGWFFVRTLYKSEDIFDQWKVPVGVKALVGGLIIGLMAIFIPEVMGVGYESMDRVLANDLSFLIIGGLLIGKIFATSISLGAGASGGIFAPSLFMGSMLGGAMGKFFNVFYPNITADPGAYALVGMAAMVAATTHAPVTAILIIFEMTAEYSVILPLMVTSIIAIAISSRLLDGNIYTLKLKRRGVDIYGGTDINVLKKLNVDKIKQQRVEIIREDASINELLVTMAGSEQPVTYVCDERDKLTGIITQGMVRRFLNHMETIPDDAVIKDIYQTRFPSVTDRTPINDVLQKLLDADMLAVPVLDDDGNLTGQVFRRDILREYQDMLIQTQSAGHMATEMKYVHHYHEKTEVIPGYLMARINTPSEFVNQSFHQLNIRHKFHVDVILICKTHNGVSINLMPVPKTIVGPDDQLLIFGKKPHVETLCGLS